MENTQKTYNYFYKGVAIQKSQFLAANPENWESEINEFGEYSNGNYKATERETNSYELETEDKEPTFDVYFSNSENSNKVIIKLKKLNACDPAIEWVEVNNYATIEEIVENCHRGDWLLWLAKKLDLDLRKLTLAKALCAKTILHLVTDDRSKNAVEMAEKYGRGEASLEELNAAYADAAAAAAKKENQLSTANICRETIGNDIIELFNKY